MVYAASAVAIAVVALNAASTLALPTEYMEELMERNFDDFEVEARGYYDEFDARDYYDEEFDARDIPQFNAAVPTTTAVSPTITNHPTNAPQFNVAQAALTVTSTTTHHPKPTSCTHAELKVKAHAEHAKKSADKSAKKAAKKAKIAAKKAKAAEKKAAKLNALVQKAKAKATPTSTTQSETATSTGVMAAQTPSKAELKLQKAAIHAQKVANHAAKKAKHAEKKAAHKASKVQALAHATHSASATGTNAANAAGITPPPSVNGLARVATSTTTGRDGHVTVQHTVTGAAPECTKAGAFKKVFKQNKNRRDLDIEELFQRDYEFDDLD